MKKVKKFALMFIMTFAMTGLYACGGGENDDPTYDDDSDNPSVVTPGEDNDDPSDDDANNTPVLGPMENMFYKGITITYPVEHPEQRYESERSMYKLHYSKETKTAVLYIEDADFLEGMPSLGVMEFKDLAFEQENKDNLFKFQKDNLIPEIGGRPFPAFPISSLVGYEKVGEKLEVKFICDYRNIPMQVSFTGTPIKHE